MFCDREKLLAQLDAHQQTVREVLQRGEALIAPGVTLDPVAISNARWEMMRVLTAYKAFKHCELFNPIIRFGTPDKAKLAKQMKDECTALGEEFVASVTRCSGIDIIANMASLRPDALRLLAKIRAHMARERWVTESMLLCATRAAA